MVDVGEEADFEGRLLLLERRGKRAARVESGEGGEAESALAKKRAATEDKVSSGFAAFRRFVVL